MANVNITQAAKLVGLSRSYFHRKYVKSGLISVSSSPAGKPQVDTSELIRVFGDLKTVPVHTEVTVHSTHNVTPEVTPENTPIIQEKIRLAELEVENRMLREQMQEMKENHSRQLYLLEHLVESRKPWWKFWG